jgi:hypothetical protein
MSQRPVLVTTTERPAGYEVKGALDQVLVVGWFVWDRRYRGQNEGSFKPTGEVFRDPTSGKLTRVYEDPTTGRRQYREES